MANSVGLDVSQKTIVICVVDANGTLDALVKPQPVLVETDDQISHPRQYLVLAVLQYLEE
jgi:hypothetical protein